MIARWETTSDGQAQASLTVAAFAFFPAQPHLIPNYPGNRGSCTAKRSPRTPHISFISYHSSLSFKSRIPTSDIPSTEPYHTWDGLFCQPCVWRAAPSIPSIPSIPLIWKISAQAAMAPAFRQCALRLNGQLPVPAPMPRLVPDAMGVVARVRHHKTEFRGAALQPGKGGGPRKILIELDVLGRTNVDGAAGVMLAEAGRGDITEDLL